MHPQTKSWLRVCLWHVTGVLDRNGSSSYGTTSATTRRLQQLLRAARSNASICRQRRLARRHLRASRELPRVADAAPVAMRRGKPRWKNSAIIGRPRRSTADADVAVGGDPSGLGVFVVDFLLPALTVFWNTRPR